ncbi:MAG: hypothetical protein K9L02_06405 [Acholeplasmataceae bacterium]|nr:hypothetical protein [Acholeplasmataceae bacterium]
MDYGFSKRIVKNYKLIFTLSIIILIFSVLASLGGLYLNGLYQDNERFVVIWQSNDFVTLLIAAPILCFILFRSVNHLNPRLLLSWIGIIWFLFYNYAYYVFGAKFNDFYLVYLLIFTLAIPVLIYGMIDLMRFDLANNHVRKYPYRIIGGYLIFISLGLSIIYIMQSLSFVINDQVPSIITLSGHITSIVFSLDFSMVILFFVITALYLFKKNPIGIALAWIFNIKSAIYMLVLSYSSYRLESAEIGLWLLIGILSLVVLLFTYQHLNRVHIEKSSS